MSRTLEAPRHGGRGQFTTCVSWAGVPTLSALAGLLCIVVSTANADAQPGVDPQDGTYDYEENYDYDEDPAISAEWVEETLTEQTRENDYGFCSDPEYVLHRSERPLCPLAEAAEQRCPAFPVVCARDPSHDRGDLRTVFGGRGGGQAKEPERRSETYTLKLPPELLVVFRLLFWAMIVLLGGFILYTVIVGIVRGRRSQARDDKDSETPEERDLEDVGMPQAVESDVARLLRRAKARASQGDYSGATDDVYAALLRYLEGQQLLVLERFRTNGDYIRALVATPDWQRLVRECGRDVERAQFGSKAPDASTFQRLLHRIEPAITRVSGLLLLILSSAMLPGCSDGDDDSRTKRRWGPLGDRGADGLSVFAGLLTESGYDIRQRVRRVQDLGDDVGMLIVYDHTSLEDEDWQALESWVQSGHQLWLAGDPEVADHFGGHAGDAPCEPAYELTSSFYASRTLPGAAGNPRPAEIAAETFQLEPSTDFDPLLTCNGAPMVSQRNIGQGSVTLFADASLLTNASMLSKDNAFVLMGMVYAFPAQIEFAGGLTGTGAQSPYEALVNAKLGQLLLQIALLMLVLYLARGVAFATLRDPPEAGRRRFLDHLEALGRVFQRARASHYALHHYAAWALTKLNDRVRPGQSLSVIELGSALAKRTGKPEREVISILADAATARSHADEPATGEELRVLKQLEAFVTETGGAR